MIKEKMDVVLEFLIPSTGFSIFCVLENHLEHLLEQTAGLCLELVTKSHTLTMKMKRFKN
jgi:hypothetical protein